MGEIGAEADRLQRAVAPVVARAFGPRVRLDLYVRTLDQDAEARDVIGGLEYLAATSGVVLHERAPDRAPALRRDRRAVVRDCTRDWIHHAAGILSRAEANARANPAGASGPAVLTDTDLAVRRACVAVCVWHQASLKPTDVPLRAMVAHVGSVAPALATAIARLVRAGPPSPANGRHVLVRIITYLGSRDRVLAQMLERFRVSIPHEVRDI